MASVLSPDDIGPALVILAWLQSRGDSQVVATMPLRKSRIQGVRMQYDSRTNGRRYPEQFSRTLALIAIRSVSGAAHACSPPMRPRANIATQSNLRGLRSTLPAGSALNAYWLVAEIHYSHHSLDASALALRTADDRLASHHAFPLSAPRSEFPARWFGRTFYAVHLQHRSRVSITLGQISQADDVSVHASLGIPGTG